jgi:diaminopimelate decarboxylase
MLATSEHKTIEQLRFLSPDQAQNISRQYGSPVYIYDEATLARRAGQALRFKAPFGLTVRYAMKANPLAAILRIFNAQGLHIDASSGYEAHRAMKAGIEAAHIMITSQQLPTDLQNLISRGVLFNATSLHQLETYAKLFPNTAVSIRLNPGIGSGHNTKTDTGGPTSSFGIWHENIPQAKAIAGAHGLTINRIHTHIGSGNDPQKWHEAARLTVGMIEHFPDVATINLGGGFKIARMTGEVPTDLEPVSELIAQIITDFHASTGRRLHLEIEPGTFLVANAGALITKVVDHTSTGASGYNFLKLDTGLTEIMRPSLYGAQHPIVVVNDRAPLLKPYVVVGHTCESGDLLTPEPGQPETPAARLLQEAEIGDIVVIEGTGAYCASLSAKGYNSFPEPAEVLLALTGEARLVKRGRGLNDQIASELE